MKIHASLPIFFDPKVLNVYKKEIQEMYGISDVKYKIKQTKDYLELTVGDEIICYQVLNNDLFKLYRIRNNHKKGK